METLILEDYNNVTNKRITDGRSAGTDALAGISVLWNETVPDDEDSMGNYIYHWGKCIDGNKCVGVPFYIRPGSYGYTAAQERKITDALNEIEQHTCIR